MTSESILIHGEVLADGSLQLTEAIQLPPGPVEVVVRPVVRPVSTASGGEDVRAFLARIRAEQQASGHKPRTAEEVDAYVRELRDEWDERDAAVLALQEQCRRQRENPPSSPETP